MRIIITILVFAFINAYAFQLKAQNPQIDSLNKELSKNISPKEQIKILNTLSLLLQRVKPDSALKTTQTVLKLISKNGTKNDMAEALKNMGNIYYGKNDHKKAIEYYSKAAELFESIHDTLGLAKIYNNMGSLYRTQGLYKEALNNYQKSLDYRYAIGDSAGMGKTYNNIGNMHFSLRNFKTALEYYQRSLNIRKRFNDPLGASGCYTNMGLIYIEKGVYDTAIIYLEKALPIYKEFGDVEGEANCQTTIGYAYLKTNKTQNAITVLNAAFQKYSKLQNTKGLAKVLILLSETYNHEKLYKKAAKNATDALKLDSGNIPDIDKMEAFKQLSMAYEKTKEYNKSLQSFRKYILIKEELLGLDKMKELENIEKKYQSETQKLQIKNLENDNKIKIIQLEKLHIRQLLTYGAFIISIGFIIFLLITRRKLKRRSKTIRIQNEEITTHKNQLEKHRNHLEQLIQERTADLIQAKEHAEESDRLKSAFLANMSHEIRTPMNAIVGFTELLNFSNTDEDEKALYLQLVQQNSNILLQLMDDIIDIAKMEAGQITIRKIKTNPYNILDQIIRVLDQKKINTGKEHIDINIDVEETTKCQEIRTDPIRFQQIITNLTDNALKFTEVGQITIRLNTITEGSQKHLLFTIEDTGIGMSSKQLSNLFKRFNKIEDTTTKLYRGAGLGLAISKNLVELLGGKIWVESTIEKGTTFFFTIPCDTTA